MRYKITTSEIISTTRVNGYTTYEYRQYEVNDYQYRLNSSDNVYAVDFWNRKQFISIPINNVLKIEVIE